MVIFCCRALQKGDVMAENELVLKQRDALGFDIQVKLIGGRELQILSKGKKPELNYSVDILSLQDKSKKTLFIAWKWLFSSIIFFLLMLLLLNILPDYVEENKNIYLSVTLLIGMIGGLFCVIKFWKFTSVKQVFYSRKAHVPIIILSAGKPSKKIFRSFIGSVEERIKQFRSHMDINEEKQLTGEMKMLRRLSDNGFINKKLYEKAKTKLLGSFAK